MPEAERPSQPEAESGTLPEAESGTLPEAESGTLPDAELVALFDELLGAADVLEGLDASQRDAWVSGLLASWRSDIIVADPAAADLMFLHHCDASELPHAEVVARTARVLLGADGDASVEATGAWLVEAAEADEKPGRSAASTSAVIGFHHGDESEHTILVEIDSTGAMVDIQVGPSPTEVLPDEYTIAEVSAEGGLPIRVSERPVEDTARRIAAAWQAALDLPADGQQRTDGVLLNQFVVAARLRSILGAHELAWFAVFAEPEVELHAGMTPAEIDEADRRTRETLTRCLAPLRGQSSPRGATGDDSDLIEQAAAPFLAGPGELSHPEREALAFLEWADWLGVVLGAVRNGVGADMSGRAMVGYINQCPEVTSTIAKRDRPFVEYALDVAAAWWADLGLIADGALTESGRWALPRAAAQAWGGDFDRATE